MPPSVPTYPLTHTSMYDSMYEDIGREKQRDEEVS